MFSVIIATYNSEKYIEQTINSLLNQSFKDWECLIVENGSTDNTNFIINKINDNRFKIFNLKKPNKSAALNYGIIKSNFDWISILDSDDLWTENKLELQYNCIKNNERIDILGTRLKYINENNEILNVNPELPLTYEDILKSFKSNTNALANSSVVYKKNIHEQIGYYDTELNSVEDYDLWKRCIRNNFYILNLENECLLHRIHKNSNFNFNVKKQNYYKEIVDKISFLKENYE